MDKRQAGSPLVDPKYCIEEARRLVIPVDEANWEQVAGDAAALNILQAAVAHLHYADADTFAEEVMQIVFTAYLMGRTADKRKASVFPEAFRALIEELDLSGL